MRRLTGCELRKLLLHGPLLAAILVCSLLNVWNIYSVCQSSLFAGEEVWRSTYWSLYSSYSGEMTLDKIEDLLALYRPAAEKVAGRTATTAMDVEGTLTGNLYWDAGLLNVYYVTPMEYMYTYQSTAAEVEDAALENVALYTQAGNSYEAERNQIIADLYSGREVSEFYYTEGFEQWFNYDFSTLLTVLLALYGVSQVFTRERECGMNTLLLTNFRGGRTTTVAKLLASTLFLVGLSLWFSLLDGACFSLFAGLGSGWTLPLYALDDFAAASVNLPVWAYAVVSALCRALGVWALGMVMLLVSMFSRHALLPFLMGGGIFLLSVLAGVRWSFARTTWVKAVNPYSLLVSRILFGQTEFVSVCGSPWLTWQAAVGSALLLGLAASGAICLLSEQTKLRKGGVVWARLAGR